MSPAPVKLAVGDAAPALDLPTAGGGRITLEDLRGAPALLWFYPAANTSLCTKQACDLRDNHQMFLDAGYRVIGISPDPVPELDRFAADGYQLVLSGHTHGGQIVLPGVGAWNRGFFPTMQGALERENTMLFVSRGIGMVYVPVRLNCPPEVALLTLGRRGELRG